MNSSIITTMASISLVRVARDVRIVGGVPAVPGKFPHHVAITYNDVFICGGSIISTMMILTAAHCIFTSFIPNPQISLFKVIAGLHNITDVNVNEQIRTVNVIYKHDGFNPQTLVHDIAILVLNEPLRYTATIRNILPNPNQEFGAYATLSGWGRTNKTELGSVHLRKVNVPIVSQLTCQTRYQGAYEITENMICMGGAGGDSCQGDSGGAAVCAQSDSSIVQCAIVSYGRGCGEVDTPGVYTRVSKYVDWINHIERKVFCLGNNTQRHYNIIPTKLPRNCEDILDRNHLQNTPSGIYKIYWIYKIFIDTCSKSPSNEYPTATATPLPRNCEDIQQLFHKNFQNAPSGVYRIYLEDGNNSMKEVFCDMKTENGGWIVIQRRSESDTNTDFFRSWNQYAKGFGGLEKSFWLGLDTISSLTNSNKYTLRVDLMDMEGEERYAEYETFRVVNASDHFRLHVDGHTGDGGAGDSLLLHNGKPFSTKDKDNDDHNSSCANAFRGAWWYYSCHMSNLNGLYGSVEYGLGLNWFTWKGHNYSMKRVEMKIRTADYKPIKL